MRYIHQGMSQKLTIKIVSECKGEMKKGVVDKSVEEIAELRLDFSRRILAPEKHQSRKPQPVSSRKNWRNRTTYLLVKLIADLANVHIGSTDISSLRVLRR